MEMCYKRTALPVLWHDAAIVGTLLGLGLGANDMTCHHSTGLLRSAIEINVPQRGLAP